MEGAWWPHGDLPQAPVTSIARLRLPIQLMGEVGLQVQAAGSAPVAPNPALPSSHGHPARSDPRSLPHTFPLLPSMVSADFCTAAVLISTGALLGRVNPVQMLLLTLLGVTLFTLNEYILLGLMGVSD